MMFYSNKLIGFNYFGDTYTTTVYVLLVGMCFCLFLLNKKLKLKELSANFNDSKMHAMDNYTFSFVTSEVGIVSSDKKVGLFTKIVVWFLIAFFVTTPIYEVLTILEPDSWLNYHYMHGFPGLH